jgi:hypothetical protein
MTGDLAERLRTSREGILASLQLRRGEAISVNHLRPRLQRDIAPLTFSQLAHWHQRGLATGRAVRSVACAIRLRGSLDIASLRDALAEVVRRHEPLRTRLVLVNGMPMQKIDASYTGELRVEALTDLPPHVRESELQRLIERLILEPVDVAVGPLFQVCLVCLAEHDFALVIAMEHTISDAVSLSTFKQELLSAYARSRGVDVPLIAVPVQIGDYAVWQRERLSAWLDEHGEYWDERLKGARRVHFPDAAKTPGVERYGWDVAPITIDSETIMKLSECSRRQRTTPDMTVLPAYA